MNFMEEQQSLFDLHLDTYSRESLSETAKWGKFLAVIGFIITGLVVIGAFTAGTLLNTLASAYPMSSVNNFSSVFFVIYMLFIAAILFVPAYYTYLFSTRMKKALGSNDQELLGKAFANQKVVLKFYGILTIIYLSLIALGVIIALITTALVRH